MYEELITCIILILIWGGRTIASSFYFRYDEILTNYQKLKANHNYIIMSFDNFKNMYYLLQDRLNSPFEKGKIVFFSKEYYCPVILKRKNKSTYIPGAAKANETLILFDSIKDIREYDKWSTEEDNNLARKKYIKECNIHYDKEMSNYLISLLREEQIYHEQEYQKAIQQATETVNRCL